MPEIRYKAFISYSHADEKWARWLHRAIETWRVPRALAGTQGEHGEIPKRLAPVFRDRDELEASGDLSDRLSQALEASDALIIICSPAAAQSRWTDQEVGRFQALGRTRRIFCLLVDGDPTTGDACFPPALQYGIDDAEPLFADPRPYADGKQLARQKIIAGLLGVPLDQIRRREHARRRRRLLGVGMAAIALLALVAWAVQSRVAEQREREKAEQLASFVVDLGERLQSDVDLETLGLIGHEAMRHLESLDESKLKPETQVKVGLALRQVGFVNEGQNKPSEAIEAYLRSRSIFADLVRANPDSESYLFELSQAHFYVGEFYRWQGEFDKALGPMLSYAEIANRLYESDPNNRDWLLEKSYSTGNVLAWQVDSGQAVDRAMLDRADEAVSLAQQSLEAFDGDSEVVAHLSMTLAWAAYTEFKACRLQESLRYRERNLELAQKALNGSPSNLVRQVDLAYAHSGLALVAVVLGDLETAESHYRDSVALLQRVLASDASNERLEAEKVWVEFRLARVRMERGMIAYGLAALRSLQTWFESHYPTRNWSDTWRNEYARFLLTLGEWEMLRSNRDKGEALFREAGRLLAERGGPGGDVRYRQLVIQFKWLWWYHMDADPVAAWPFSAEAIPDDEGQFRHCVEADLSARMAVINGNRSLAEKQVKYLKRRHYADPTYARFCTAQGMCPAADEPSESARENSVIELDQHP